MSQKWSRAERLLALNLYFKLPFGQQHSGNPKVNKLAEQLDRTPGSINMKLNNYAAIDHTLDREGLDNYAQVDQDLWDEYWNELEQLALESEYISEHVVQEEGQDADEEQSSPERILENYQENYGREVETKTTRRLGQRFFRNVVLSNYEQKCAVCHLQQPQLIEAAHIVAWEDANDPSLRVNPRNGIALCKIHHSGFDCGHLDIDPEAKTIHISQTMTEENSMGAEFLFKQFHGTKIFIPEKLGPEEEYLRTDRCSSN